MVPSSLVSSLSMDVREVMVKTENHTGVLWGAPCVLRTGYDFKTSLSSDLGDSKIVVNEDIEKWERNNK